MRSNKTNLPELQVVKIHGGVKCYWLCADDTRIGSKERYFHPDCVIWVKGSQDHRMDYAVSLALQDARMPVRALWYNKK